MRNQFLYARKNTGYCQINDDYTVRDKKDLLLLESMQNYLVADGLDLQNLPDEYYVYNDKIGGKSVWIEGKTTFVPAGSSKESGSRDTSLIHKYIYSDESYDAKMSCPVDMNNTEKQKFYRTVEDYWNNGGEELREKDDGITYQIICDKFGFTDQSMIDFIICCVDSFPKLEKRVYCYLPSSDKEGTFYARKLMEMILSNMPECVLGGAGFITYSSTFHNPSLNPIPGNISVIFIPDNMENRMLEKNEQNRNYIFDMKNYKRQHEKENLSYIGNFVNNILQDMKQGGEKSTKDIYQKLREFVKQGAVVDVNFLGAYMLFLRCVSWSKFNQQGQDSFYRTLAGSVGNLLSYENYLTDNAQNKIKEIVLCLLYSSEYSEQNLAWIDHIYKEGKLCRDLIIGYLCDICLNLIETQENKSEEILKITNYNYYNEDMNDLVISKIYSMSKYYPVGQRLIYETLNPLRIDSKKTIEKKKDIVFSLIQSFYKDYPSFVISPFFMNEIKNFLLELLLQVEDEIEYLNGVLESVKAMNDEVRQTYYILLQDIAYSFLVLYSEKNKFEDIELQKLHNLEEIIQLFDLKKYEQQKIDSISVLYVDQVEKKIIEIILDDAFQNTNAQQLLTVLERCKGFKAERICWRYRNKIKNFISLLEDETQNIKVLHKLFCYFYSMGEGGIMKAVLYEIYRTDGIEGLRKFDQMIEVELPKKYQKLPMKYMTDILKSYYKENGIGDKISQEEIDFAQKYDVTLIVEAKDNDLKKEEEITIGALKRIGSFFGGRKEK